MMRSLLFALLASVAVAFAPAPMPVARTQTTTALNGAAEAAVQITAWCTFFAWGANKFENPTIVAAAPAAAAAAPAADGDVSIPYDAAAQLAYAAAGSPGDFESFKAKYEADAVADVIAKKK